MNVEKLIQEAHANSARHGFWGLWKFEPASQRFETKSTAPIPICRTCNAPPFVSYIEGTEGAWTTCPSCGATDDPSQRELPTKIALIHSEISEALEEFRLSEEKHGGPLGAALFECPLIGEGPRWLNLGETHVVRTAPDYQAKVNCEGKPHKPVGFMSELADVAIRLFDLAGWLSVTPEFREATTPEFRPIPWWITSLHAQTTYLGSAIERHPYTAGRFAVILTGLDRLSKHVGGDLLAAIDLKMKYNATRPVKHGGKRI